MPRRGYLDNIISMAKVGLAKADLIRRAAQEHSEDPDRTHQRRPSRRFRSGAAMSFSFMTDRGFEGYSYNHGKHIGLDGSKPLTLLEHLGGNPLVAVVARGKVSVKDYEEGIKQLKKAYEQLDEIAKDKLKGEERSATPRRRPISCRCSNG